jgi:hypothetical protein
VSSIGGEVVIFERGSENDLIKRQVRISDYNNARQKSKLEGLRCRRRQSKQLFTSKIDFHNAGRKILM